MSDETVTQAFGAIVAAEAEHQDITTDALMVQVTDGAFCSAPMGTPLDQAQAWSDQWIAPPEAHPNFPQHRWDELTEMTAARLCAPCPVRQACLALAERLPSAYSGLIRGGLTPALRRLNPAADAEPAEEGR